MCRRRYHEFRGNSRPDARDAGSAAEPLHTSAAPGGAHVPARPPPPRGPRPRPPLRLCVQTAHPVPAAPGPRARDPQSAGPAALSGMTVCPRVSRWGPSCLSFKSRTIIRRTFGYAVYPGPRGRRAVSDVSPPRTRVDAALPQASPSRLRGSRRAAEPPCPVATLSKLSGTGVAAAPIRVPPRHAQGSGSRAPTSTSRPVSRVLPRLRVCLRGTERPLLARVVRASSVVEQGR